MEAREEPNAGYFCTGGSGDPGGVSTRQSKGCRKILREKFYGRIVSTVAVAPERLCDDCNMIGVRHSRWMSRQN